MTSVENPPEKISCSDGCSLSMNDAKTIAMKLKALAHPVRLQILQFLGDKKKCCCNDFCASIPLAQSTISQHLKILNEAGLIDYQAVGNCSNYSLNPDNLEEVVQALSLVSTLGASTLGARTLGARTLGARTIDQKIETDNSPHPGKQELKE